MRRPSVRAAIWIWLLAALLLSVLLAACAGGARAGIASAGENKVATSTNKNSTPVDQKDTGVLYAQCIRANGLPDF